MATNVKIMEILIIDKEEFVGLLTKQIAKGHELLNLEVSVSAHTYSQFGRPKIIY